MSVTLKPSSRNIYLVRRCSGFSFLLQQLLGVFSLKAFPPVLVVKWNPYFPLSRQENYFRNSKKCSLLLLSPSFMTWDSDVGGEDCSLFFTLFRQLVALWLKSSPAVGGYACLNWLGEKHDWTHSSRTPAELVTTFFISTSLHYLHKIIIKIKEQLCLLFIQRLAYAVLPAKVLMWDMCWACSALGELRCISPCTPLCRRPLW